MKRGGVSAICPPLVVAPNFGTLELIPASSLSNSHSTATTSTQDSGMASINSSIHSGSANTDRLLSLRRRPVQITADPRVYKGSVYANRRTAANNAKQVEKVENREKRYRVGVIRDQLTSLLPRVPLQKKSTTTNPNNIISRSPNNFLPELRSGSIDKKQKSFATARFAPIRNSAETRRKISIENNNINKFPVKVMVNFDNFNNNNNKDRYGGGIGGGGHRIISSQTATPPTSSRPVYPIVNSGVQTDDDFDEKFDDLVKELANSAISMAVYQIEGEDELARLRTSAQKTQSELRRITQQQNEQTQKYREVIMEKTSQLENWKQHESEAREAQKIALETCQEVTRKTLENLRIIEKNSKKSVATDTREMNRLEAKMNLVTAEIEKDFLPWMFQRAERMFKNQIVKNQLDHSMLNEVEHRREQAKKRLINMNSHLL
ncbi:unnamed protein product [Caenorhabditis angaria]|uniref:Uncharacterized protein n=1 Tax=Caenorhabditis angaria TaxID=860376 RepID=A0A9P1I3L2_9PELO|nr:unnamed protein product [Caenorhabditis angaria]